MGKSLFNHHQKSGAFMIKAGRHNVVNRILVMLFVQLLIPQSLWAQADPDLKFVNPNVVTAMEVVTSWNMNWSDRDGSDAAGPVYPRLSNPYKLEGIIFSSSNTNVATIDASSGNITAVAPGTTTIKATFNGNGTYSNGAVSYTLTYTDDRSEPGDLFSFAETTVSAVYGGRFSRPNLNYGQLGESVITYSSTNTSVVTVDASTGDVAIGGVGTANIQAYFAGNNNYKPATASYVLTVYPRVVIVSGGITASDKTYDGTTAATLNFSNVTINSVDGYNGIINGDVVTVSATGTFADANAGTGKTVNISNIKLEGANSGKYSLIETGNQTSTTATISKAAASVTAPTAKTLTYTGSAQELVNAGTATGGSLEYSLDGTSYSATIPTGTDAKTYTVYYRVTVDSNHDGVAAASLAVTISKAAASVTAPTAKTLTYTGSAQELVNAGTATGGSLEYSLDGTSYSATIPTGTDAKTYTVYYRVTGDSNHDGVAAASLAVTIGKAAATVTAPTAKTLTYTGSAQELVNAGTATGGSLEYSLDGTGYSATVPTGTDAKTYTVYYRVTGDSNHDSVAAASLAVTIGKAAATVTAPTAKTLTYTGSAQELVNAGTATGGSLEYSLDGTSYSATIPTGTDAKTYTVYYRVTGDSNHDGVAAASLAVTISKAAASVTAPTAKTLTYTGSAQELVNAGTATGGSLEYSLDGTSYSATIPTGTDAKTYTVYYRVTGDSNHDGVAAASLDVTISKAAASVTAPTAKTLTYTGSAQELVNAGTATGGSLEYSLDGTSYSATVPTGTDAKTYTVYYRVTGDSNHDGVAAASLAVTIGKATGSISFANTTINKTFGDADFTNAVTKTGDGTVSYASDNTSVATVDANGKVTIKGSGSASVTATVVDGANYTYAMKTVSYTLTVGTAPMSVTASGYTGTYDGKAHGISVSAPSGATVKYGTSSGNYDQTSSPTYTNAGSYTVYYQVTMANYTAITGSETVTISKAVPSVTAPTANTLTYTGSAQALVTGGSTNGGTLEYSLDGKTYGTGIPVGTEAGTYTVYYRVTGNANYSDVAAKSVTVTISKSQPTITTAPTAKTDLVYTGFAQALVNAGTATDGVLQYSLDGKTYSTAIPTGTNAGSYDVWYMVKGDIGFNDLEAQKLTVTISKADAKVTYYPYAYTAKIGEPFDEPSVMVEPAGLTLTYYSSDKDIATVDELTGEVTLVAPGKVNIYAEFAGNDNYNRAGDYYVLTVLQRDIEPIDEDVVIVWKDDDFFVTNDEGEKEEKRLINTVIYDILFTLDLSGLPSDYDGYDETEHCVVLNYPMSEDGINRVISKGLEPGTDDYARQYTGLTFKVPAGRGYVIIDSRTDGDYQMMVKIGSLDPIAFNHTGREKDSVLYECSEPTWVYVYNGGAINNARMESTHRAKKTKGHVMIYSITRSSSGGTGIERINSEVTDEQDRWYDLQGNRIERPLKKGIYILRGRKVVVK